MSDVIAGNLFWPVALLIALLIVILGVVVFRMLRARAASALVVTISQRPGFLHAIVTGRNTSANIWRYFDHIMQECHARNCYRVLVEERLAGPRLGTAEVFDIAAKGSARFFGQFAAAAFVDVNGEGPLMNFAELVATNRGLPVAVFSTVAAAEQWLLTQTQNVATTAASVMQEKDRSQT